MEFAKQLEPYARAKDYFAANPQLRYLFFELTDRCNLRCRHCGSSCPALEKHHDADVNLLKDVVDQVAEHTAPGDVLFCLTGGEPMLWPQLTELGRYITDKGYNWGMTTNGTLLTPKNIRALAEAGLKTVTVSLDGPKENHQWLRQVEGSFDAAVAGIWLLAQSKLFHSVQVTTVVSPRNLGELEELYRLLRKLGVQSWKLTGVEPIGIAQQDPALFLSGKEYRQLLDFILEKRALGELEISFGCSHFLPEEYAKKVRDVRFHCGCGIFIASISAKGEILGCLDVDERKLTCQGNIQTDRFWEVWENRFQLFREKRKPDNGICAGCAYADYCRGGSWHTWDFAHSRPRLCLLQHLCEKEEKQ